MSHKNLELLEGAIFISDAHYSAKRPELLAFIIEIHSKKIACTQLVLMGDIFDALFGGIPVTSELNREIISLLNQINERIELIYLEGNHDFKLHSIFPNAQVFPLVIQPISAYFKGRKLSLAHGDFDVGFVYRAYASLVNNSFALSVLNTINALTNNLILHKLDAYLSKKDDCKEFVDFKSFVQKRKLERNGCDYFLEGHYHQNLSFDFPDFKYINLAAFACNQRYFIVKSSQDNELVLEEKSYKEI